MRFVQEYANHKKKVIRNKSEYTKDVREEKIAMVDVAMAFFNRGLITVDDAMKSIAEVR